MTTHKKKKSLVGWMVLGKELKFDRGHSFCEAIIPEIYKTQGSFNFHEDRKYSSPVKVRITIEEI